MTIKAGEFRQSIRTVDIFVTETSLTAKSIKKQTLRVAKMIPKRFESKDLIKFHIVDFFTP